MAEEESFYKETISNKDHTIKIKINIIEKYLNIKASFNEDYITTSYESKYSLEELQNQSKYYNQFDNVKMIIKEIKSYNGNNNITAKEEENKLVLIFPIGSAVYQDIQFTLELKKKTEKEKIEEYEKVLMKYKEEVISLNDKIKILENKYIIKDFHSEIIKDKNINELIKIWISPFKDASAKLIYHFFCKYKYPLDDYELDFNDVGNFHKKCDNKTNILIILKSKDEIFGGFTPLSFLSDNSYGYDNDSFVFSINKKKKYPKINQDNCTSIWKYKDYGPCFSNDLYFKKGTMNLIYFEKRDYTIPHDFIDKKNTINDSDNWILLDSLEIFEIKF